MKNIHLKKVVIILLIMLFIILITPKSFATITPDLITGEVEGNTDIDVEFVDKLIDMIRFIGIFLAVGIMMIIGIKYITGSIEEKATYKKTMIPYIVGCILLFGAATIAPKIIEIFKDTKDAEQIGNVALGAIQVIGTFITVGTLMILGIKYMLGSLEERAGYKKTMLPYVIGVILLFGAVNITAYVYDSLSLDKEESYDKGEAIEKAETFINNNSSKHIYNEYLKARQKLTELSKDNNASKEEIEYWTEYAAILYKSVKDNNNEQTEDNFKDGKKGAKDAEAYIQIHNNAEIANEYLKAKKKQVELSDSEDVNKSEIEYWKKYSNRLYEYIKEQNESK